MNSSVKRVSVPVDVTGGRDSVPVDVTGGRDSVPVRLQTHYSEPRLSSTAEVYCSTGRVLNPILLLLLLAAAVPSSRAAITATPADSGCAVYIIKQSVELPISCDDAYDAMTGDISGWWDHSFSGKPYKLYIEPKPGGGFIEEFNEEGDGAQHAVVEFALRGRLLRFTGPLGLSGRAIHMVHTWRYEPLDAGCRVTCEVHIAGDVDNTLAGTIDAVWRHFLVERLKPYIEEGKYKDRGKVRL